MEKENTNIPQNNSDIGTDIAVIKNEMGHIDRRLTAVETSIKEVSQTLNKLVYAFCTILLAVVGILIKTYILP